MKTSALVDAFLTSGRARGLAPGTLTWYRIILRKFAGQVQQLPRKPEPVEKFLAGLEVGRETRWDYYRALRVFFAWCERRYGVADPSRATAPPKRSRVLPRTLSSADLGCVFLVPMSPRNRALVELLLDTGVRIGEAVTLRTRDLGRDSILVDGKTGPREVPISESVRSRLVDIAGGEYVFEGPKGHLTPQHAYLLVRRVLLAAGIQGRKLGPHTLRHTFGRHFIMAGGDAFSLQKILGHSNIQTTRIYVELNTADIVRQHHKYTPMHLAPGQARGRVVTEAEEILRKLKGRDHGR